MEIHSEARIVPREVAKRHRAWGGSFKTFLRLHYSLGVLGVLFSALAAVNSLAICGILLTPVCGILAAVCIAIMGFVRPEDRYFRYVNAWRILDSAIRKYTTQDDFTIEELNRAVDRGESYISKSENGVDPL